MRSLMSSSKVFSMNSNKGKILKEEKNIALLSSTLE